MPEEILTDRGTQFTSHFSQELFRLRGCSWLLSTAYHPQTDGQTERINRVLEDTLRHYISPRHDDCNEHLPHVEFSYNNAYQESIATSPFMLTYGVHPRVPGLVAPGTNHANRFPGVHAFKCQIDRRLEMAKECVAKAQARQETYYNQHRREAEFQVGQEVLLSTAHVRINQCIYAILLRQVHRSYCIDTLVHSRLTPGKVHWPTDWSYLIITEYIQSFMSPC